MTEPRRVYPLTNLCKWGVIEIAALSPSATDELHAAFRTQQQAKDWMKQTFGTQRGTGARYQIKRLVK